MMVSFPRYGVPWKANKFRSKLWMWFVVVLCFHGLGFHRTKGANIVRTFYIPEGRPAGTEVGRLSTQSQFFFSTTGTPSTWRKYLDFVNANGIIRTKVILDRENVNNYNLTVFDSTPTKYEVLIHVQDLNDNSPQFVGGTSNSLGLFENDQSFRHKLIASDPDLGFNSTQRYSIISGNTGDVFKLITNRDPNGHLYADLALGSGKTIDREVCDAFVLKISASDGGNPARKGYLTLNISIQDVNDNSPVFFNQSYSASIPEDAHRGKSILKVTASDRDIGTNAQIRYSIEKHSDPNAIFGIDQSSGLISNNVPLDFEKKQQYRIIVRADDLGSNTQRYGTAVVLIQVLDVNDNDPVIHIRYNLGGSYQVTENAAVGTPVARVSVTDSDSGSNGEVNVTLEGGDGFFSMQYDATTSESIISVGRDLDREKNDHFFLKAVCTDRGDPARTVQRSFRINVGDVNDNAPVFDRQVYVTRIMENATINTLVAKVHAVDQDYGLNAELVYSIVNTSQSKTYRNWFKINPIDGEIRTASSLDREKVPQPVLLVLVTDKGSPPHITNCTVIVNLTDNNDNDPYFNQSTYNASLPENSAGGVSVVQLFAEDSDIGENSFIQYTIPLQNLPFQVNLHTGLITTFGSIDHEHQSFYLFQAVATDGGGRHTPTNVHITIEDLNDNSPVFSPVNYNVNYYENIAINHVICKVKATDADSGAYSKLRYIIEQGNGDGIFVINSSSGVITLAKNLDRETNDTHVITIKAVDGGSKISTNKAFVTVKVLDINDEPPIFSKSAYSFSIVEKSPPLSVLGTVHATSKDLGTNAEITYSVIGGNTDNLVQMNSTGTLYLRSEIDHERTPWLHLRVQAKDRGMPPLYGYTNVTISVIDLNDNTPQFNSSVILVSLPEDTSVGQTFYIITAHDPDGGSFGQITYTLANPGQFFKLDSSNGALSLKKAVDYEDAATRSFSLSVTARDGGSPPESSTATLDVRVVDVNDHSPVFLNASYAVHVTESLPADSNILKVSAADRDSGDNARVTYSFRAGDDTTKFGLRMDGWIYIKKQLNREDIEAYKLTVIASDHGTPASQSTSAEVKIIVDDINDNNPQFGQKSYTFYVVEEKPSGTVVATVSAIDIDKGSNAKLQYSFDTAVPQFAIDTSNGKITTRQVLDREKKSSYVFTVVATDGGSSPRVDKTQVTVVVQDINDNSPVFNPAQYSKKVRENIAVGSSLLTVTATDADEHGINSEIRYSIAAGQMNNQVFKMDAVTGVLTVLAPLDREKKDRYILSVVATDRGSPSKDHITMVEVHVLDVNDNSPRFLNLTTFVNVPEKLPIGSIVTTVNAVDNDDGDNGRVRYEIASGNTGGTFVINATSGVIRIQLGLDFERKNRYDLKISAMDMGQQQQKSYRWVTIYILDANDNRPTFDKNPIITSVLEGVPINHTVTAIQARDDDSGFNSKIWYSIDSQLPKADFKINSETGVVQTIRMIDREDTSEYTLIVRATDQAFTEQDRLHSTATLKIIVRDVNDNKPVFVSRNLTYVMEDEPFNFQVTSITALDPDTGLSGKVEYRIVSIDTGEFSLDHKSGVLKLIRSLDYETVPQYILKISATDEGRPPLSSFQFLKIIVVDVNDNPPEFPKDVFVGNVSEGEPVGTPVVWIIAQDKDSGTNAMLTYSIPSGVEKDKFVINATSGLITTNSSLDREKKDTYFLTVHGTGRSYPFRVSTTTVKINVLDKNDNPPTFPSTTVTLKTPENSPPAVLYTITAKDPDFGINAKVRYHILRGNVAETFSIGEYNGELATTKRLDRELIANYDLTVEAKDVSAPFYTVSINVTVEVEDRNDNVPAFLKSKYSAVISELSVVGISVLNITAVDRDLGSNGNLVYTLSNNTYGVFRINSQNGILYTAAKFDTSLKQDYEFYCIAKDQGADPKMAFVQVRVQIEDKNTHAPVFTHTPYPASIFPNTTANSFIIKVNARDADTNKSNNGRVTYRFNDSFMSNLFVLQSNTGNVLTSSSFNNPAQGRHILYILAEDHGLPSMKGYGIVEIIIGNVQDDPPRFINQTPAAVSILENSGSGAYVTRVVANSTSGSRVSYSIISGNIGKAFYIDPQSGVVSVAKALMLDYETVKMFQLQLVATLQGRVSLNGYMTLKITLIDVNDNLPVFHPTKIVTQLAEDHQPFNFRFVVKVTATDSDTGSNAEVSYLFESGNDPRVFTIDPSTGVIKTAKTLDRETTASYDLIVKATDNGNPTMSSTCQLQVIVTDLNDNPPIFTAQPVLNITEDTRPGTVLTIATATDKDEDSRLVYTLKTESSQGMFEVDRFSAAVTLLKVMDFETTKSYTLGISVNDSVHTAELLIKMNVLDVNDNTPTFLNSSYQVTLSESIAAGKSILKVSAIDKDSGSNGDVRYFFLLANTDYQINATSGVISSRKRIEVEIRDSFSQILVAAADEGRPMQQALVYARIVITREPKFEKATYTANVREDATVATPILTVKASDNAPGLPLGRISYSIDRSDQFRIGQRSGIISVNKPLDYETTTQYLLVISAVDDISPSKYVRVTVWINVTDVNDQKPVFGQAEYLAQWVESVPIGTNIVNITATDRDSGPNGRVWFSIQSGDDKDSFSIDRSTGMIKTRKPLDHDSIKTHHLSVRATDEGNPPLHSEVSVTIQVLDLNDNPPVFHIPNPEDVKVRENAPIPTIFYNITSTDRDSGSNGRVSYSIVGGEGQGLFLIDPVTGWLRTNASFDYEVKSTYTLQVKAVDAGSPQLQSNITIIVNIAGVDEFTPEFAMEQYKFEVPGNAKVGHVVGIVSASDDDGGQDGVVLFSFQSPRSDAFIINITSGAIIVNRTLNDGSNLQRRKRRSIDYDRSWIVYLGNGLTNERSTRGRRVRRATEKTELYFIIRADSGRLNSKAFATATASVTVDFTCSGCGVPLTGGPVGGSGITGTALALIVGLGVLAGVVILAFIVVLLLIYSHRKRKRTRQNPPLRFDGSFDEITVHPRTSGNSNHVTVSAESISTRTYPHAECTPLTRTTNNSNNVTGTDASGTPGSSGSASSGRGSSEGDFEEEPVPPVIVNGEIGSFHSDNNAKTVIADSGIQQDDDQISQLTISDGSGILHVDGFGSESKSDKTDKTDKILARLEYQSQESMHVFGEEGGGEADGGHDVGNLLYAKLAEVDADDESIAEGPRPFVDEGRDQPLYGGSLSSIIGSQEELTGSYNWDYLLDWGPQFQPLAEVFLEIGRMKDDVGRKKDGSRTGSLPSNRLRTQLPGIATADMLSSMSSLPRSPISPPSTQYTSPAFSPNFTPAITPLITRSPSVSPLDTGTVSPAFTPHGVTPRGSRPTSTHIVRLRRDSRDDSDLSHSPSISDNESNLEIDV